MCTRRYHAVMALKSALLHGTVRVLAAWSIRRHCIRKETLVSQNIRKLPIDNSSSYDSSCYAGKRKPIKTSKQLSLVTLAGTQLLEKVLQTASEDPAVQEAYLHVQVPID